MKERVTRFIKILRSDPARRKEGNNRSKGLSQRREKNWRLTSSNHRSSSSNVTNPPLRLFLFLGFFACHNAILRVKCSVVTRLGASSIALALTSYYIPEKITKLV
jgi:hypothetical protein